MDAKDLLFGCSACYLKRHGASSWTNVGYKWDHFVRFLPLNYPFVCVFVFVGNLIFSRSYIMISDIVYIRASFTPQRTTSLCSLQMMLHGSVQAKWVIQIDQIRLDLRALQSVLWWLDIARNYCRTPQVCIRPTPVLSPLTLYSSNLSRHGVNSPREPEDLFMFRRNPFLHPFEASY